MSIWPTEVQQCASSVLPVHALSGEEQQGVLQKINQMFLNRVSPQEIQKTAHAWARQKQIVDFRPDVENGLVVVGFAGGGGSCEGIKQALGFEPHIAMNHNPVAMAMHAVNHPRTLHYPEDIFSVDPKISTGGLPVLLGWFSPDCRHFSKAKGGTPVRKEIRGLAWVVLRWALAVRPRYLMLENVEEFRSWGPLKADKKGNLFPDPAYTGETFKAFIGILSSGVAPDCPALAEACEFLRIDIDSDDARRLVAGLGYNVDHKELRACDYGAPTIRKRLFVVSRCDGEAVVWPDPSHGAPDSAEVLAGQLQPYRTAAECIDWSIPTRSIMGRKKPLADNTLRRIVKGLKRYVIDCPDPYIVQIGQTGFGGDGRQYATGAPLTTVTSKAEHLLIEPFAVKCNHTSNRTKYDCFRGQSGRLPLQTVTPMATIPTESHAAVASVHMMVNTSGHPGGSAGDPIHTITTGGHHAVVAANLIKHYGGNYTGAGLGMDEPMHTVTQVDHHSLCTSHLVQLRGTCKDGRPTNAPAPTLTAGGNHIGHVTAYLQKYYGNEKDGIDVDAPMHTVPTHDRFGLTEVKCEPTLITDDQRYNAWCCARLMDEFSDEPDDSHLFPAPRPQFIQVGEYMVVDICMRMLEPRELYNANGFPRSYIIDQDIDGTRWPKSEQVARCGNSVPPPFAEALVRANMPQYCVWKMAA